ncbi:MAG: citrate (Si)-synthase [Chitinophagales bacterium]|nr:citrate (Si)-synthase [Chitinophagales bacterium]
MDLLKEKFYQKSQTAKAQIREILKDHGSKKVDEVKVEQLIGGMRSVKSMLWDTSSLDPEEGIRFRGYNIPQLRELLPRVPGGKEPLPEGLFWLMMTGEIPTEENVRWLSAEWFRRSEVPSYVYDTLRNLPKDTHPMTQFSIAILALQNESIFAKKYEEGMNKNDYWDPMYEDSMNMIAKLPKIAAFIFRHTYFQDDIHAPDPATDWAGNFAKMLGYDNRDFLALMRLYLTIHADHEGGNASAHTMHLIGSTLSDVYYSFSGSMNALAGPLHGLANQEVIKWIFEMVEKLGTNKPSKDQIRQYILDTLDSGKVVPGYGHAVLRQPDPRFMAQMRFAQDNIKDDPIVQIVWDLFEIVPEVLGGLGKVKNPWPNVDAHSGSLLVHYGMNQYNYYTVLFGVSRALGVSAGLCWDRALGLPLERPKSITTEWLSDFLKNQ